MLVTVLAFGVTGVLAREAILLAVIPSAVITTMFAEEYGIFKSESSTTILATCVIQARVQAAVLRGASSEVLPWEELS